MPFRPRTAATGAALAVAAVLLCPAAAEARPPTAARAGPPTAAAPGWSAAPTGAARTAFYLEGPPGTALTDRLAVRNPTGRPLTVRLAGDGGVDGWLAFGTPEVTVPPRTQASVPFTVTVPDTAAPGGRPGGLTVTGTTPGTRTRIPIRLRVTGPTLSALTVEQVSVTRRGSAALIHYTLVNRGNTALRPRLEVRADGLFGSLLRRPARTLPDVLPPGARADRTETWSDPPALDAVDVRLTATAAGGARDTATARYTAAPWGAGGALLLLLAAGGGGWAAVRRRRRAGRGGRTGGDAPARPGPRPTDGTRRTSATTNGTKGTQGAQGVQGNASSADASAVDAPAADAPKANGATANRAKAATAGGTAARGAATGGATDTTTVARTGSGVRG
ncbi:COG1470 family protein [Streptomyces noursei]|uniref:COG1470 family protein n=1 Tax=Streptomyces noursei TaxID=1971 RepID=UPI003828AFEA